MSIGDIFIDKCIFALTEPQETVDECFHLARFAERDNYPFIIKWGKGRHGRTGWIVFTMGVYAKFTQLHGAIFDVLNQDIDKRPFIVDGDGRIRYDLMSSHRCIPELAELEEEKV